MFKNMKEAARALIPALIIAVATPASASSPTGNLNIGPNGWIIHWLDNGNGGSGGFAIHLTNGAEYWAYPGSSPGCGITAPTLDTVRLWASFAQAALLSGRKVNIYFNDCPANGTHYISGVALVP